MKRPRKRYKRYWQEIRGSVRFNNIQYTEDLDKYTTYIEKEVERLTALSEAADSLIFCFATRPLDIRDTLSKMNWDKSLTAKAKQYNEAKDKLKEPKQ